MPKTDATRRYSRIAPCAVTALGLELTQFGDASWQRAQRRGLLQSPARRVPGFVLAITITQLALFAAFAVNMALQCLRAGPGGAT